MLYFGNVCRRMPTQPSTLSEACLTDDEAGPPSLIHSARHVWLTMIRQAHWASNPQWGMFDDEAALPSFIHSVRRVWLMMRQGHSASYPQWGMFD